MKDLLQLEKEFENDFDEIGKKSYLMFYTSDAAEEFLDFENEEEELDDIDYINSNISENNNSNSNIELTNMEIKEDKEENDNSNIMDVYFIRKKKRNYNDTDILKSPYEPYINK